MLPWLPAAVLLGLVTISGFYHAADKVAASPRSYHRHRLVRVTCAPPSSDLVNQAAKTSFPGKDSFNALFEAIDALANAFPGDFDVWGMKSQDCTALVRLAPRRFDLVDSLALRFSIEILHEDVAQLIAAERDPVVFEASGTPATPQLPPFLTDYHKLEDIFKFMDEMVAKHSDLVKPVEIGQSFEGRPIRGLRIRRDTSKGPKFGFVMHGGQHAREWISVAMMNYMIHRLVSNGTLSELLDSFEMIVVPVLNPDGYVWSWEKDRMWRKNRQPNKSILPIPGCVGTDLNRNWGFKVRLFPRERTYPVHF